MSSKERDLQRLTHILSAISDIESISEGSIEDKKTYYSTIYLIQIIGEAANKISEETKTQFPEIGWREIISMRNFIAHEYDKIDINIVENTVKNDIPFLKQQLQNIIISFNP